MTGWKAGGSLIIGPSYPRGDSIKKVISPARRWQLVEHVREHLDAYVALPVTQECVAAIGGLVEEICQEWHWLE